MHRPSLHSPVASLQAVPPHAEAADSPPPFLLGRSKPMAELRTRLDRIARSAATVLILGETGTGKELAARHIHAASERKARPFVPLNCAALPEPLMESELFGHARGAFTGAHQSYAGKIRAANGGTLFLDEIGDMPLTAQAKVLRFLESGEIFGLGALKPDTVDVRVVAATNHDLPQRVREGLFRKDLYYRLNIASVEMCRLSERKTDLEELTTYFLERAAGQGQAPKRVSGPVRRLFQSYSWPGNVRELRNVLESASLLAERGVIRTEHLPAYMTRQMRGPSELNERERLLRALVQTNWNKSAAAQRLNWSRMTLYRKLSKYALRDSRERDDDPSL